MVHPSVANNFRAEDECWELTNSIKYSTSKYWD
nr:CPPV091 hypothetical protein [Cooks petrelpox virus]